MKKQLLFLLIMIISFCSYGQISFENGYYINNSNEKISCLIKNIDWNNNPTQFEYKLSENSESQKGTIKSVKEFGINNISKYIRSTVNIDRSSDNINDLSDDKNPIYNKEILFLKVLIEGKSNLYEYADVNLKRYFYNIDNAIIEPLIYKRFNTIDKNIGKNYRFRQQLWVNLKCPNFKLSQIENIDYKKNDLVKYFIEYNECQNATVINYEQKQKIDFFNLTLRPRINNSSLYIVSSTSNPKSFDFDNEIGFGFGIEFEFILPYNKNKWAIAIEPTYQNYKSETISTYDNVSGGDLTANVDYSSIEIPFSIRHYFFLNKNSKIFVNASYILDVSSKTLIELTRVDGSNFNTLEINSRNNFGMGIGFKQSDKYSLEIRYQTSREILGNDQAWSSNYKTLSFIIGYSFF
ncbi:tRNA modification GTPase [Xanthomarina sp. GH4-25]|uniref:tRNA modification GTPase n=1 Tax=Xanthomarina sp. GH4-25 TaxID=3349335 RepID=UPI000D67A402|nr:tRNA modification GTPase [Flavobacteriaceae bacterium LYZ1037]